MLYLSIAFVQLFFFLFGRHLCLNLHWVWQLPNGEMTRAKKLTMNITSVGNQLKSTLILLGRKVMVKTFVITLYILYSDEYDLNFKNSCNVLNSYNCNALEIYQMSVFISNFGFSNFIKSHVNDYYALYQMICINC